MLPKNNISIRIYKFIAYSFSISEEDSKAFSDSLDKSFADNVDKITKKLGCSVEKQMIIDGTFPTTKFPNPEFKETLALGIEEKI